MALLFADRVQETSTTTGTGTLSLAGAVSDYNSFVTGVGSTNQCYYTILSQSALEWEVGKGTVTAGAPNTLSRTTVYTSSNSNALVSFAAGTKNVFCTAPSNFLNSVLTANQAITLSGAVTGTGTTAITTTLQPLAADLNLNGWSFSNAPSQLVFEVAIVSGGTGYVAGDVLTVSGGTFATALQILVGAVSGGVITACGVNNYSNYSVQPTNPAAVTGGTGTGATFNLTFSAAELDLPYGTTVIGRNVLTHNPIFGPMSPYTYDPVNRLTVIASDSTFNDYQQSNGALQVNGTDFGMSLVVAPTVAGWANTGNIAGLQNFAVAWDPAVRSAAAGDAMQVRFRYRKSTSTTLAAARGNLAAFKISTDGVASGDKSGNGTLTLQYYTTAGGNAGTAVDALSLSSAGIDAKTQKIINLVDPTSAQHAATKAYVDAHSGGISALTGDVTASGSGSVAATLANTAITPGTYTAATFDGKGRATGGANMTLTGAVTGTGSGSALATTLSALSASLNLNGNNITTSQGTGYVELAIVSGGTGYVVGDVLTVSGGSFSSAAQIYVGTVSAGVITGAGLNAATSLLVPAGIYTVFPSNPVSVTGGTGTGATFTLTPGAATATINPTTFGRVQFNNTGMPHNPGLSAAGLSSLLTVDATARQVVIASDNTANDGGGNFALMVRSSGAAAIDARVVPTAADWANNGQSQIALSLGVMNETTAHTTTAGDGLRILFRLRQQTSGVAATKKGSLGEISALNDGSGNGSVVMAYYTDNGSAGGLRHQALTLNSTGVDVNTTQILNVVDPTTAQMAATKAYVDATASTTPIVGTATASGSTTTITPGTSQTVNVACNANSTYTVTTGANDGQRVVLRFKQDATGSRTVAFDSSVAFGTDIPTFTATTTAAKTDIVGLQYSSALSKWMFQAAVKGF